MGQLGICCVESKWSRWKSDLEISAAPALELLASAHNVPYKKYKESSQQKDFLRRLNDWSRLSTDFGILYIGAHGSAGSVSMPAGDVNLDEIASYFEENTEYNNKNCIIHFWSCSTLRASEQALADFLDRTKFEAISGYQIDVGWIKPLAFDLLFLDFLISNAPRRKLTSKYLAESRFAMQEFGWYSLGESMSFTIQSRRN